MAPGGCRAHNAHFCGGVAGHESCLLIEVVDETIGLRSLVCTRHSIDVRLGHCTQASLCRTRVEAQYM